MIDVTVVNYTIEVHLYHDHGLASRSDFNENILVYIIDNAIYGSPKVLTVREHLYIHTIGTLRPLGLNSNNAFNFIPLLPLV